MTERLGLASRGGIGRRALSRNLRPDQETVADFPRGQSLALSNPWQLILPLAAVVAAMATGATLWFQKTEYFWRSPIVGARFQTLTDFDGSIRKPKNAITRYRCASRAKPAIANK